MSIFLKDQCHRPVQLPAAPQRIISLVPSQTELLFDLGLEDKIVGITRFCVHPEKALKEKRVVGGTKKVVKKRLIDLQPDLIICNKEENTMEMVEICSSICPIYVSDVSTLEDALEMIQHIGHLTASTEKARDIIEKIQVSFQQFSDELETKSALYLVWKKPYMTVGRDTFIHDMMRLAGFENVMGTHTRYPQLEMDQIVKQRPEVILLSSEPYNFSENDKAEFDTAFKERSDAEVYGERGRTTKANLPQPRILIVDGEPFSWYGSRLLHSPAYFQKLRSELNEN
ncbi:hypothetical protein AAU57_07425 [Nonlabens sp. YIK11]|uniref:ABC transporter substrate-binding protein n=1 Tax=Nonlabens sp. YIK11 TaxID=1453349 RepID=UPI0006DC06A1|nr:helical backbone metal receptor [Nonlabens sp. YIK11]KQC33160.1 hypothetical protein AAU57_07425 [Nonlabens sp. YIK11]